MKKSLVGLEKVTRSWRKWRNRRMVTVRISQTHSKTLSFTSATSFYFSSTIKIILTENYELASSTPTSTLTWISWFCSLPGHEYFCEVTEEFIEDDFNLTGLNAMVPFWKEAMEMVLDVEPGVDAFPILNKQCHTYSLTEDEDTSKIPDVSIVESSAEMLYGLVHQRYILTRVGLQAMVRWFAMDAMHQLLLNELFRLRNMKQGPSVLVHASIALGAMLYPVDG
jgi:Casein kinase II regulatory subunit